MHTYLRRSYFALLLSIAPPAIAQGSHAVRLDGVGAYGTATPGTSAVASSTWEAWVRLPSSPAVATQRPVLSRWGYWTHSSPNLSPADGSVLGAGGFHCVESPTAAGTLQAGGWHHLATVFGDGASPGYELYVDGVLADVEGPGCQSPADGWEIVLGAIGSAGYSSFLAADVDEARISGVRRYQGPFVPERRFASDAATIALWHFDEGAGGVAADASGNGRHLQLHGGFAWVDGVEPIPPPVRYCTPKTNSLGCLPTIGWSGLPSASGPDTFWLTATSELGQTPGMLLWSSAPASIPFHGGTLCVQPPLVRAGWQPSGGAPLTCTGTFVFHVSQEYLSQQLLTPGTRVYAQWYGRDPGFPHPDNVSLTDAVEFVVGP